MNEVSHCVYVINRVHCALDVCVCVCVCVCACECVCVCVIVVSVIVTLSGLPPCVVDGHYTNSPLLLLLLLYKTTLLIYCGNYHSQADPY